MKDMIIGVDLAKRVFQVHGATTAGDVKFRKKLSREQFRAFMASQPAALVVFDEVVGFGCGCCAAPMAEG